jgi:lysophospholipase L1-like esterase
VDRRWILGGLLLAGGIGVARIVTAHPKVRDDTRLLLIGDSAGVSGSRIDQWIDSQWLTSALEEFGPTLILISLGTNDAYSNFSPEQVVEHMRSLLARVPEDVEVVWIGVPGLPASYSGRSPNLDMLEAIEGEAPYYYESHDLEIPRGPDALHPTARGYAGWAGDLWDWLT